MQELAFKIASHITHPVTVAAFAIVFVGVTLYYAVRARKYRIVWILVPVILILGLAPLAFSTFLQVRGIYRVRVVVLGADHSPVESAHVTSSSGGEPKKVEGGWEFDIPPQTRPADGKVVLFASARDAFLTGSSTLVLAQDYYPTISIQLSPDDSSTIRGVVLDEHRMSVAGATVSIAGYQEVAQTDGMGNFVLAAHAADGQVVQLRAQKGRLVGSMSAPAGRVPVVLIIKRP